MSLCVCVCCLHWRINVFIIVEVAKALGGSFKLVMLAPKTVREMTQLPKETKKTGDTNKSFQPITWQVLITLPEQPKDSTHSNEN